MIHKIVYSSSLLFLLFVMIITLISIVSLKSSPIETYSIKPSLHTDPLVSIFVINHQRPHNIRSLLQNKSHYSFPIGEIIICNTHPSYAILSHTPLPSTSIPVHIVHNFVKDDLYGAARRWKVSLETCRYPYILYLDDDIIPSPSLVLDMYHQLIQQPFTIYGPIIRKCSPQGYHLKPSSTDYNIVLTPILMTSRSVIESYLKDPIRGWDSHEPFLKQYRGNGEDLSLNSYLYRLNIKPVYVNGFYTWLDTTHGYSAHPKHHVRRNFFCKYLFH